VTVLFALLALNVIQTVLLQLKIQFCCSWKILQYLQPYKALWFVIVIGEKIPFLPVRIELSVFLW